MTAGTLDTIIRMGVDSADGVRETTKLDKAFTQISSRSAPMLAGAFRASAAEALSNVDAFGSLGRYANVVSGTIGSLAGSLGAINPLFGIAGAAIGFMVGKLSEKDRVIKEVTASVYANADALVALINGNTTLSSLASKIREEQVASIVLERSLMERKVQGFQLTQTEINLLMNKNNIERQGIADKELIAIIERALNVTRDEAINRLLELNNKLDELSESERRNKETKDALALATKELNLNLANEEALSAAIADQLKTQASNAQRLLDIEVQRAQVAARGQGGGLTEIIAGSEAIIAAEQAAYEQRISEANAFDGSRQVLEAEFTLFVEQEEQRRTDAVLRYTQQQLAAKKAADAAAAKSKQTAAQMELKSMAATAAQMLLIQKASLGEAIEAIIAEQQARLAAIAIVAAVEAVFYAFTNPAVAASKAAAAAMAGAGVGALGVLRGVLSGPGGGEQSEDELSLAGDSTASSSQRTGRTLVQQGPITLNYHAILTVQGHVLDITDLHDLFSEWNEQQLRRAGFDTKQRAKGNG